MELRHLRYFIAVAEELHFGRAAERLHISQPPLSQQIKALECELGVQLLSRTQRKVELTPAGQLFLEEARLTLQQAERAQRVAWEAHQGVRGRIRVGFVTSASYSILPSVIRRFRGDYPHITMELIEMTPSRQLAALESREIDVGILRPPVENTHLEIVSFLEESLVIALPVEHPQAAQKALDLESLSTESYILFPRHHGPGIYDVIMEACHRAEFIPQVSYAPNEMQTILAYVAGGLGISLVPQSLTGFHTDLIRYLLLKGDGLRIGLSLVTRPDDKSVSLQHFRDLCLELGTQYVSRIRKQC